MTHTRNDAVYFLSVVLVGLGDFVEQAHDDLNVLYFLARLNLAIVGEAVLVEEDRLGVFGHHDRLHFVLHEGEVELSCLQVLVVVLVPIQPQQGRNQFELEEEVNTRLVAPVDQLHNVRLNTVGE